MADDDAPWKRLWPESSAPRVRTWGDSNWNRPHLSTDRRPDDAVELASVRTPAPPAHRQEAEESLRPLAPLEIVVRTSDGSAIADAELEIVETGEILVTDADGVCRTTLREGPYEIRFTSPPLLPPVGTGPGARTIMVESTRVDPFMLSTGDPRFVVVRRPRCTEILVDGYAMGSVVLRWGGTRQRIEGEVVPVVGTTRAALAMALLRAQQQYMVVVGHADPEGSDTSNAEVAMQRARSSFLFTSGQHDLWASHAAAYASELDFACAMVACSKILGESEGISEFSEMPALDDPASIRDVSAALRRWGGDATAGPSPSPTGTPDDWRLVAEAYDLDLSRLLGVDSVDLGRLRESVTWVGAGHGELGERFPRPRTELDLASQMGLPYAVAQRRSSLVVMARADAAVLLDVDALEPIFDGTWSRATVETPAEVLLVLRCTAPDGTLFPRARVWLRGPLGVAAHVADAAAMVTMVTIRGTHFEVVLARAADDTGTLVRLQPTEKSA